MRARLQSGRRGYTVVELMATLVIVTVLAATVGTFFARLLSLREREREEAYVREKLSDLCGAYADALSVAASFSTATNGAGQAFVAKYRQETGGVSLETGVVTRVAHLAAWVDATNRTAELRIYAHEPEGGRALRIARSADGSAPLIPLAGALVRCTLTPLNVQAAATADADFPGLQGEDAALGWLELAARYTAEDEDGKAVAKTVTAGRVVRLWNRE